MRTVGTLLAVGTTLRSVGASGVLLIDAHPMLHLVPCRQMWGHGWS